jgi:hypothetical protein
MDGWMDGKAAAKADTTLPIIINSVEQNRSVKADSRPGSEEMPRF